MSILATNLINRILIVGLGSIGKRHLMLARELMPKADIRVLRHQYTSEIPEYSNGNLYDLEGAIGFRPQVAIIANPATFHLDIAQTLAENGVHLLIEKPLSVSVDGVVQLIEICQKKKLVLMTGYNLRFLDSLEYFRDSLNNGVIGKILSVRCEIGQYLPTWRPGTDYSQGVSSRSELGGGALLELSHEIDYLRWIFGEVDWVNASLSRQSNLNIDVEDTVHMILGFSPQQGSRQLIGTLNLDFIRQDATRLCTAIGELGSLRWNGLNGTVHLYKGGSIEWRELFAKKHMRDDSYRAELSHFINCAIEKKNPLITGEDGLKVLQIVEAARQSSLETKRISITLKDSLQGSGK